MVALPVPLGINARIASSLAAPDVEASTKNKQLLAYFITEKFRLQSIIRRLMPKENVSKCLRSLAPVGTPGVEVKYSTQHETVKLLGLHRCKSVWMCPICSSRISEHRKQELEQAIKIAESLGLVVLMETFTFRHHMGMPLKPLLREFNEALRAYGAGRSGVEYFRSHFGLIGRVSAFELTYGAFGWHPHRHCLSFVPRETDIQAYSDYAASRWPLVAARFGLEMNAHGYRLDETYEGVSSYLSKYGPRWSAPAELTKATVKRARSAHGLTPFALAQASELEPDYIAPFQEYCRAVKGLHQLQYSRGLRELLSVEDISDAEIIEGTEDSSEITLAQLSPSDWRLVLANDARAELVQAASTGDTEQVRAFIELLRG